MKDNDYIYYIRFLLTPIGAFFSCLFCSATLVAHFYYPEMRKRVYNIIAFLIITCHLFSSVYILTQCFRNFGFWKDDYEYNLGYIYFDTFKGMFGTFFTFSLCAYYVSLSDCIISLCKVYNARQQLGQAYLVLPLLFAFVCLATSTFLLQDVGIKDYLIDGITDGSLSELLHVIVVFMVMPYVIYSMIVVHRERQNQAQNQQNAIGELAGRHIMYGLVFLLTIFPACVIELLPMLLKTIPNSHLYIISSNIVVVFFSCSGIGVSIIRLYDPYVKQKIQSAIAERFGGEMPQIDVVEMEDALSGSYLRIDATISSSSIYAHQKNIFEQVEERAVYDDILGSLAGVCLMVDSDYEAFYKKLIKLPQAAKLRGSESEKCTTERRTFQGQSFPPGFVNDSESYSNFVIDVKEYAREYTQHLRVANRYTKDDFFESLCPATNEAKLRALFDQTSGRGGYPLFSTKNKKFIIKQISQYEKSTLLKTFLLPYHQHVIQNSSFICHILGLFAIRVNGKFKIYIMIMQNIDPIPSELVDFKYDLKMSTVNRQQLKNDEIEVTRKHYLETYPEYGEIIIPEEQVKKKEVKSKAPKKGQVFNDRIQGNLTKLKDMDFKFLHDTLPISRSQSSTWEMIQSKMAKDVKFLESINIMDYSLILTVARTRVLYARDDDSEHLEEEKLPAEFARLQRNGNCLFSPSGKFAYIFGIIDILQEYDIQKRGEGGIKGMLAAFSGKKDISCQPPNKYAERFLKKLGKIFKSENPISGSFLDEFSIN